MSAIIYPVTEDGYTIVKKIGSGSSSDVYYAHVNNSNLEVAVKLIDLEDGNADLDRIRNETTIMLQNHHDNLTNLYCSFISDHYLWIVMPWLEAGSCTSIMKKIAPQGFKDEKIIATIVKNILQGVAYIHKNNEIHRDIKPGNILVSQKGHIQLSDFGITAQMSEPIREKRHTFVGTMNFMAPEIVDPVNGYDEKVDIWAIGITALELAYANSPYNKLTPLQTMQSILNNQPPTCDSFPDHSHNFSKSFKSFVKECLQKDAQKRPSAETLLKHSFMKNAQDDKYIVENIIKKLSKEIQDCKTHLYDHHSHNHNIITGAIRPVSSPKDEKTPELEI